MHKMKIGIIGCGNMGQALIRGIITKAYLSRKHIWVSDKDSHKLNVVDRQFNINTTNSNNSLAKKCDVVIFAVKPQDLDIVIKELVLSLQGKLVISICAGVTIQSLEQRLGKTPIIRGMPNMPAFISQGITAISLGKYTRAKHKKVALKIFSCIGETVEIKEALMNAVTAISGSGPAYFFYLTQRLIETAQELGISQRIAQRLALKTALGSVMLLNRTKESARILRERVTSKGGTTEAAFDVFKKRRLDHILACAFKSAAKRAKQLEKDLS
jgi:pyrroline-5-carboxylate reductase